MADYVPYSVALAAAVEALQKRLDGRDRRIAELEEQVRSLEAVCRASAKMHGAAETRLAALIGAAQPFAEFASRMKDAPDYSYTDDRIKDWLGVSDFTSLAAAVQKAQEGLLKQRVAVCACLIQRCNPRPFDHNCHCRRWCWRKDDQ